MKMSSQLDLSGCKKRKRGERVFKFTTFGEKGCPADFNGSSFQENVRALLEYGELENGACGAMASWSFQLEVRRHPLLHVFLFVVEEPIELSLELHCKHCQYIGWGHHMICNKKYHFLLPSKAGSGQNCKSDWNIELHGDVAHKMHGVFHSNGLGHLLRVNGLETGSDLAGYRIMDFWDRLCSGLGARKVSLKDVAMKKGMDLRLLHAVAYGKPWFGRWDYTFGRGSYGVTQEMYQTTVNAIRNIPLSLLIRHDQSHHELIKNEIQIILSRYQVLTSQSLVKLGDLFRFMFELKSRFVKESSVYPGIMLDTSCRWSPKRVEMAIHVVVEALKRSESKWVSRQHVRDVARAYIGDTGLLDFVLKSLGNHIAGKYFVRRCLNPVTKVLEYCLEDVSPKLKPLILQSNLSWAQLTTDILYMNNNVLTTDQTKTITSNTSNNILSTIAVASRIILDTKYLVKEYRGEESTHDDVWITNKLKLYCAVILSGDSKSGQVTDIVTPYHCFTVRKNATFGELKFEVEKTFREMYWGLKNFTAISIQNVNQNDLDLVFKTTKSDSKILFECDTVSDRGILMEVVDCACGTKDDDGERMICCDICQVWRHTRCVKIPDTDEVPHIFLCSTCEQDIMLRFPNLP